ncbi:ABC transporter permease [Pseudonocardia sp. ICBG601]|uniref:ABC transporter permease n=1 Tax=Pseudonocardia sp. ICBG601 TaxID=2846759 RepID=UPI001CF6FA2D|nr:ABC transporter permease subunit [Pseudonocardia sp. ICBG601]
MRARARTAWWVAAGVAALLVVGPVPMLVPAGLLWVPLPDPDAVDFAGMLAGPSAAHPLGTDQLGRDLLARTVHGGRLTVGLALSAVLVTGVVGVAVGSLAAVAGPVGRAVMRVVDVLAAIPVVLFGLLAAVALGPGVGSLLVAVTVIAWTPFARQAYLLALAERQREYVTAAVALGAGPGRVLTRHVARNLVPAAGRARLRPVREHPAHRLRTVVPRARRAAADRGVGRDGGRGPRVPVRRAPGGARALAGGRADGRDGPVVGTPMGTGGRPVSSGRVTLAAPARRVEGPAQLGEPPERLRSALPVAACALLAVVRVLVHDASRSLLPSLCDRSCRGVNPPVGGAG